MSWMSKIYGCENSSFFRVSVISIFYICAALWLYGWWVDFIPSEAWASTGIYASISLTVIYYPVFYFLATTQNPIIKIFKSNVGRVFQFCILAPSFIFVFWGALVHGAADLITQAVGKPKTIEAELSKVHRASRRSCDYRLEGYAIQSAMPNHICISRKYFNEIPEQVNVSLQGKATFLGFHVNNVYTE